LGHFLSGQEKVAQLLIAQFREHSLKKFITIFFWVPFGAEFAISLGCLGFGFHGKFTGFM
jgi:hypothetical protein